MDDDIPDDLQPESWRESVATGQYDQILKFLLPGVGLIVLGALYTAVTFHVLGVAQFEFVAEADPTAATWRYVFACVAYTTLGLLGLWKYSTD